jgi:hypothetical protein
MDHELQELTNLGLEPHFLRGDGGFSHAIYSGWSRKEPVGGGAGGPLVQGLGRSLREYGLFQTHNQVATVTHELIELVPEQQEALHEAATS